MNKKEAEIDEPTGPVVDSMQTDSSAKIDHWSSFKSKKCLFFLIFLFLFLFLVLVFVIVVSGSHNFFSEFFFLIFFS